MKVISFCSGKGGVGKTTVVSNLGSLYAKAGKRVLLVDGDWSLGKLGIALGVRPQWTVEQVLRGEIELRRAIHPMTDNLSVLASPSGVVGMEELEEGARNTLFFEIEAAAEDYDVVLFDHASGVGWAVLQFAAAAHQHVVITTPEPTSYTDAYAIMKLLNRRFSIREFFLLVTMSDHSPEVERILSRFRDVVYGNLDVRMRPLGVFPYEPKLNESIRRQQPFVDRYPGSRLTVRFQQVCEALERAPLANSNGLRFSPEARTISAG